ncbi:MAG: hypothetical protein OEL79_01970 [Chromatiales bacterium]|nr:hypothetical protein [Chromatiales bacterium]
MHKYIKKLLLLVGVLCFSTSLIAGDCSWTEKDCVADDLDDVAEGTMAEDLVRSVTDEIRDIGENEDNEDTSGN